VILYPSSSKTSVDINKLLKISGNKDMEDCGPKRLGICSDNECKNIMSKFTFSDRFGASPGVSKTSSGYDSKGYFLPNSMGKFSFNLNFNKLATPFESSIKIQSLGYTEKEEATSVK